MSERFTGLIIVGERRSPTAVNHGWSWEQCQSGEPRLCAIKLWGALSLCGYDPTNQIFLNAFHDDGRINEPVLEMLRTGVVARGYSVIGMGKVVQEILSTSGVEHTPIVHPAARGIWKKPGIYEQHVKQALSGIKQK